MSSFALPKTAPFSEEEFLNLLRLAKTGVAQLVELQKKAVA